MNVGRYLSGEDRHVGTARINVPRVHIPAWLYPQLGHREMTIVCTRGVRCLQVDQDGNRLPAYQQILEAPTGEFFTVDSRRRQIIN
jgi:hypothetical protein